MSITLTDEQFGGVKEGASWFELCENAIDQYGFEVETKTWNEDRGSYDYSSRNVAPSSIRPFVFTGFAGSGKSTCVGSMIEHIGLKPEEVMFMAPTGKAAKVLSRKLKESGWPIGATTIHKAIYMPKSARADAIEIQIKGIENHVLFLRSKGDAGAKHHDPLIAALDVKDAESKIASMTIELGEAMDSEGPKFNLKSASEIPPEVKLFVIDEASMVGTEIVIDLESFGIPIMAIGDPGQLPPVGDDWGFDMENPNVFLKEIHRQAADNPIIRLATMAREGRNIPIADYGDGVRVVSRRNDDVTFNMERDAMVLVGTNKKRWDITTRIRKELGWTETGPMEGEPLLVCRNSRQYPGLVNGTLLRCKKDIGDLTNANARIKLSAIDEDVGGLEYDMWVTQGLFEEHVFRRKGAHSAPDREAFRANKECEHVDWGHAITVHKSQGSEFEDVALHDESPVFRQDAQRWLYTGITRASHKLTVIV